MTDPLFDYYEYERRIYRRKRFMRRVMAFCLGLAAGITGSVLWRLLT